MNTVIQPDVVRAEEQAYSDRLRRAQDESLARLAEPRLR